MLFTWASKSTEFLSEHLAMLYEFYLIQERGKSVTNKTLLISLHSLQDELEAVHHLYPTLFYFMHFWKEMQLYTRTEHWQNDEVCQDDGLFKLLCV